MITDATDPRALGEEPLPIEYYIWLASIEPDVRARDLTAEEISRLRKALRQSSSTGEVTPEWQRPFQSDEPVRSNIERDPDAPVGIYGAVGMALFRADCAGMNAPDAIAEIGNAAVEFYRHRFASPHTAGEVGEHEWPDIGVEPLTLRRPRDIGQTKDRLRDAMCVQQPHVPDGTALVWRTDLLDAHHRAIRMEALAQARADTIASLTAERDAALVRCEGLEKALRDKELGDA